VRSRRPPPARFPLQLSQLQKPKPPETWPSGFRPVVAEFRGCLAWSLLPQAPGLPLEAVQALALRLSEGWIARVRGDVLMAGAHRCARSPQFGLTCLEAKLKDGVTRTGGPGQSVPLPAAAFADSTFAAPDIPAGSSRLSI